MKTTNRIELTSKTQPIARYCLVNQLVSNCLHNTVPGYPRLLAGILDAFASDYHDLGGSYPLTDEEVAVFAESLVWAEESLADSEMFPPHFTQASYDELVKELARHEKI